MTRRAAVGWTRWSCWAREHWAVVLLGAATVVVGCSSLAGGAPERKPEPPVAVAVDTPVTPSPAQPPVSPAPEPIDTGTAPAERRFDAGRPVRVAFPVRGARGVVSAGGDWRLFDNGGRSTLVRAGSSDAWTVESRADGRLRAVSAGGRTTSWRPGPFIARPVGGRGLVVWNGKRYRGEVRLVATDSGLLAVNVLGMEDYLRGVVPVEIGNRTAAERAAAEAQAVAARSYAWIRLSTSAARSFDLMSTVADQVYGGADVERAVTDAAVSSTAGLVLLFGGRVANAPYHSTCGGSTAAVTESWWRRRDEPYLQRTSDRIPGGEGYWCDAAPRQRWTTELTASQLQANVDRYLRSYAAIPAGGPGIVRAVRVDRRTPSGRVGELAIVTDRGTWQVRGDDVRWVLRTSVGEILNSTYFSVENMVVGRDGRLSQLTLRGSGYGHGIGMCQWGAIGRARAGQDFRAILRAYYPGTTVGRAG